TAPARLVAQVQPRQLLVAEVVPGWFEPHRIIDRADVEMRLGRQLRGLAGEGRAAGPAKAARRARRRLELRDLPLRHPPGLARAPDEHRDRRAAVPPTALAMTPEHALGLARRDEAHGTAEATTFDLRGHRTKVPPLRNTAAAWSTMRSITSRADGMSRTRS